jgi:hypothetical protein
MIVLFQGHCALRDRLRDAFTDLGLYLWEVEDSAGAKGVLTREGQDARVLIIDHAFLTRRKARFFIDIAMHYSPSGWIVHLVDAVPVDSGLPGILCRRDQPSEIVELAAALCRAGAVR